MRILDGRKDAKNSPLQSPQDRLTACGKWFEYPPQNQSTRASSTLISNPFAECTTIAIHMLELRYVLEHSLNCERAPRLLRYLLGHGADEFSIAVMTLQDTPAPFADAFEDELGPYERPTAFRRVLTNAESVDMTRRIRLWALNETSLARLLSFMDTGLLQWPAGPDG